MGKVFKGFSFILGYMLVLGGWLLRVVVLWLGLWGAFIVEW